jgi:hypothetical protein
MKELLLCALLVGPVESPPPRRAYVIYCEGDHPSDVLYREWNREKWVLRFMRLQMEEYYNVVWVEVTTTGYRASDCPLIVLDRETIKLGHHNVSGKAIREMYLRLREARAEKEPPEAYEYDEVLVPGLPIEVPE